MQLVSQRLKAYHCSFTNRGVTLCNGTTRLSEEDRGEDNKDPDWLIEQSIVRQVAGGEGGVTLCNDD